MRRRQKMRAFDEAGLDETDGTFIEPRLDQVPVRWTHGGTDPATPDWCCPGCARVLVIGLPRSDDPLLVRCPACSAVGIVP